MNFLSVLVCLSLAVLVSSEKLSLKYQQKMFEKALNAEKAVGTKRHFRPQYIDYTSDCCRTSNSDCEWVRKPVPFRRGSRFRRRGCFYYKPQKCVVYCGCDGEQLCSTTTTTTTTESTTTTTVTTTTTTTTTPTTTTTTTTSTTATTRFCPAEASTAPTSTTKLLNGITISGCGEFPGLVAIQTAAGTVCTGVMTSSTTLSVPSNCATSITNASVVAQDGTVIATGISASPNGVGGPVQINIDTPVTASSCPGIACVYSNTMLSDILLDTCKVAATGYDVNELTNTSTPAFTYLDIPSLQPTSTCEALIENTLTAPFFNFNNAAITYNCFLSPTGSSCVGDFGGPIQCDLTTGEKVVIGQVESGNCSPSTVIGFYNIEASSVRSLPASINNVMLGLGNTV